MSEQQKKWIIAKYADETALETFNRTSADFNAWDSVVDSYTARQLNITKRWYDSEEQAKPDLEKLVEINPSVAYGLVLVPVIPLSKY